MLFLRFSRGLDFLVICVCGFVLGGRGVLFVIGGVLERVY